MVAAASLIFMVDSDSLGSTLATEKLWWNSLEFSSNSSNIKKQRELSHFNSTNAVKTARQTSRTRRNRIEIVEKDVSRFRSSQANATPEEPTIWRIHHKRRIHRRNKLSVWRNRFWKSKCKGEESEMPLWALTKITKNAASSTIDDRWRWDPVVGLVIIWWW